MTWIDSSFAVEWLLGSLRASKVKIPTAPLKILPNQYIETMCFFSKQGWSSEKIIEQLEPLYLGHPDKSQLQLASQLYLLARKNPKSKVSLADSLLAAVVIQEKSQLLAFDQDFSQLGLVENRSLWKPA